MKDNNQSSKPKKRTPQVRKHWADEMIEEILRFKPNPPAPPPLKKTPLKKNNSEKK